MMRTRPFIISLVLVGGLICGSSDPLAGQSKNSSRKAKAPAKTKKDQAKPPMTIDDMQKEQARLRAEAEKAEKKVKESVKKETLTLADISALEQKISQKRRAIRQLQEQEKQLTEDIREAQSSIGDLEQQLEALKSHYARYVRSVYKYGRVYDVELLFSAKSINQLYIRIAYLKRFSEQRAKDLQNVVVNKTGLEKENKALEETLDRKHRLLATRTEEETSLKGDISKRRKMLATIRKDKNFYAAQARELKEAASKVDNIIVALIKAEAERKAAAERAKEKPGTVTSPTPVPAAGAGGVFASQRGKLRWPVTLGTIAAKFGNQVHPVLKTIRENTGIDIKVNPGSDVLSVADGEVSIMTFIPGFGNIVILSHGDGYRTVYGHLSEINVSESQRVRAGDVIAKSGDSAGESTLHFEIWKDRDKQNPEYWLAKQR